MQLTKLRGIVSALNPGAEVLPCEYGKVDLRVVLGSERESWIAHGDDEDDFRVAVKAAKAAAAESCQDPACTDESHAHSHGKAEVRHLLIRLLQVLAPPAPDPSCFRLSPFTVTLHGGRVSALVSRSAPWPPA